MSAATVGLGFVTVASSDCRLVSANSWYDVPEKEGEEEPAAKEPASEAPAEVATEEKKESPKRSAEAAASEEPAAKKPAAGSLVEDARREGARVFFRRN